MTITTISVYHKFTQINKILSHCYINSLHKKSPTNISGVERLDTFTFIRGGLTNYLKEKSSYMLFRDIGRLLTGQI